MATAVTPSTVVDAPLEPTSRLSYPSGSGFGATTVAPAPATPPVAAAPDRARPAHGVPGAAHPGDAARTPVGPIAPVASVTPTRPAGATGRPAGATAGPAGARPSSVSHWTSPPQVRPRSS